MSAYALQIFVDVKFFFQRSILRRQKMADTCSREHNALLDVFYASLEVLRAKTDSTRIMLIFKCHEYEAKHPESLYDMPLFSLGSS